MSFCKDVENSRILITGGAGFIGSHFVHYILEKLPKCKIVVLDKLTYAGNLKNLENVWEKIQFFKGDISRIEDVKKAMQGCDFVVNFAAESHVDHSLKDPHPFIRTNIEGVLNLLEMGKQEGIKRFLQISTDEVYGDLRHSTKCAKEDDVLSPSSPYSASKAGAEYLVVSYEKSYGLDIVITRGSNTYGPHQYPEKIIPLFILKTLNHAPCPVYGDGSAVRDYMYVEDHCSGIYRALLYGKKGHAYNLGAGLEISGKEIVDRIAKILKQKALLQFVQDRLGHDYRYSIDSSKAKDLGWERKWDFERGLKFTIQWYEKNRNWWHHATE